MATTPALLAHLADSATSDFDGEHRLLDAVDQHRRKRDAWYGGLVGLLVVRASAAPELERTGAVAGLAVAVVADTGVDRLGAAVSAVRRAGGRVRRVEAAVAKRGEDPVPGLGRLIEVAGDLADAGADDGVDEPLAVHAEIPLTGGLLDALDLLAEQPSGPGVARLGATFRIGGLAGELFPPPGTFAGVICACRDRGLAFSVNAGLDRALRHNDHETGFAHHGVLNVLVACLAAAGGAGPVLVTERLATNDPLLLAEAVRGVRSAPRPLWTGYTTSRLDDLVHDLSHVGVLPALAAGPAGATEYGRGWPDDEAPD